MTKLRAQQVHQRVARGFTLLELMVAITILGVLLGIGVPSLTDIIRSNRLSSEVNGFVTALNYARSEAYKQGTRISVCAADTTGNACSSTVTWNQGWIAFTDGSTTGTIDGSDITLQKWPASTGGFTYTPTPTNLKYVSFLPLGAAQTGQWEIYKSGCTGNNKRQINVTLTGRISLAKISC